MKKNSVTLKKNAIRQYWKLKEFCIFGLADLEIFCEKKSDRLNK